MTDEAKPFDWPQFKDCPFCGKRPRVQFFPWLTSIGCDPCHISMGFPGSESTHEDGNRVNGHRSQEFALIGWNTRANPEGSR